MTRFSSLVAVVLFSAGIGGVAHAAPPAPSAQSAAIAVEGDYVYVVENGSVYKLSSKDLKPVASARLTRTKPAAPAKTRIAKPNGKPRRTRHVRRRSLARKHTTWQRVPMARKTTEAGLPE